MASVMRRTLWLRNSAGAERVFTNFLFCFLNNCCASTGPRRLFRPTESNVNATALIICEIGLLVFGRLSPIELDKLRDYGRQILTLEGDLHGKPLRRKLKTKVSRLFHAFWLLWRELKGANSQWKSPGYEKGADDQFWDNLSRDGKETAFIFASVNFRALASVSETTYRQIRTWAEGNIKEPT